ncbi:hypothetical protein CC78DRAFT_616577 [Lojkania enalia]|uniref:Uncharacterized protein n=1 Tax=Lojkania enalia TaxID=147567 RepID=A0A9P4KA58_9PLEO|nr:hypothetical protein CC78DRAFT_616577 [Didymosphaeria enalia]
MERIRAPPRTTELLDLDETLKDVSGLGFLRDEGLGAFRFRRWPGVTEDEQQLASIVCGLPETSKHRPSRRMASAKPGGAPNPASSRCASLVAWRAATLSQPGPSSPRLAHGKRNVATRRQLLLDAGLGLDTAVPGVAHFVGCRGTVFVDNPAARLRSPNPQVDRAFLACPLCEQHSVRVSLRVLPSESLPARHFGLAQSGAMRCYATAVPRLLQPLEPRRLSRSRRMRSGITAPY